MRRRAFVAGLPLAGCAGVWRRAAPATEERPAVVAPVFAELVKIGGARMVRSVMPGSRVVHFGVSLAVGCVADPPARPGLTALELAAVVEAWAFVAAGTLVAPGKRVPTGQMMMGNPGKLVRALTDKDRAWITHSWNAYAKRTREYLAELASR